MYVAIILIHVLLAISLIALVLLQRGKGAEAGAAFGGGASQTVLGSQGASKTLARLTGVLAALFFVTSLGLAWLVDRGGDSQSGIPDARVIEQQRTSAPSLDDGDDAPQAPAAQQDTESGSDDGLSVPSTGSSNDN
ncbi:preprotein translocase subunit SecG [Kushneria marisflavi]|uniref:Protein-export membrane protein SecG n=1 Tax=Kushneria marisflavi TaxID=157779 RepID=A0A240UR00_9GAMM|nr:preprotein translocase subunit SecG [Kushneria marisflavi]ART63556.1 preprotein translocase subunit SecG [Kushneria marisflavi]RKD75814.1 protein translocase subunit secG [Kushneria marisflavi]